MNEAAKHKLESVAFPCISTGLFGFPQDAASDIAVRTLLKWLEENPGNLKTVVFAVFTDKDRALYDNKVNLCFGLREEDICSDPRAYAIRLAKNCIEEADAVLVVAGAGMSVKQGESVYTNSEDFERHYP